jgi:hypothetical protein
MPKVDVVGFTGMDNVSGGLINEGVLIPQFIMNALPSDNLRLKRREGSRNVIDLPNAHSLWQGSVTLCVADNVLYQLNLSDSTKTSLGSVEGGSTRMYYIEVGEVIYLSNKSWCKALENSTLRTWGQSVTDEEAKNWVRHTNGREFFEKDGQGPGFTPRQSEFVHPAKPMKYLTEAFGRIWGAIGTELVYSDPASPEWFQNDVNSFSFNSEIKLIARGSSELYIGFDDKVVTLSSGSAYDSSILPEKMDRRWFDVGVVEDTLQYCNFGGEIGNNVPVWLSPKGVMVGADASIIDISGGKLRYDVDSPIGSGFYMYRGQPLYIATMLHKEDRVVADEATHNWITKHI